MEPGHRKTRKVYDREGDAHFLTFSCFRRLPLLSRERTCQWLVEAIDRSRQKNPFNLWAWVIMPEHVHLVLLPHEDVGIASILTTMKQSVSRRAINWLKNESPHYLETLLDLQPNGKQSYRFWQRGGGYDRNLGSVRDIHEKIQYVHRNPIRRKVEGWSAKPKNGSGRAPTHGRRGQRCLFASTELLFRLCRILMTIFARSRWSDVEFTCPRKRGCGIRLCFDSWKH